MTVIFILPSHLQANSFSSSELTQAHEENMPKIIDWSLQSVGGKDITLSDYQGKPVILVFWATWCPYCKKLLPGMQALHEKYNEKGLVILAVNIREDWKPDVYWDNHEYSFDAVLEGDDIAEQYGIKGTPGVVFIAPAGEVLKVAHFSDPEHPSLEKFAQHFLK